MLVGIDAISWSNNRGYGRFTRSLLDALFQDRADNEYILFVDSGTEIARSLPQGVRIKEVATRTQQSKSASASGRRSIPDMLAMSQAVAQERDLDVFFFPTVYSYFPLVTRAKIIVGIHDVIAEDFPDLVFPEKRSRLFWNVKSWLARRQAHLVMTVSEHAKAGLKRRFGLPDEKIWVVGEAPDPVFRRLPDNEVDMSILGRYGIDPEKPYLIYVGGINPHKNLISLVTAFDKTRSALSQPDLKLVIVGDTKDGFTPGLAELKEKIDQLNLRSEVIFTGFVADPELVHILNRAKALVLPSFAEGFGLPAIEAAACGIPIIATLNSPLPNLLPGAGFFVNPEDLKELTESLIKLVREDAVHQEMARTALAEASRYTWTNSATQMKQLLQSAGSRNR